MRTCRVLSLVGALLVLGGCGSRSAAEIAGADASVKTPDGATDGTTSPEASGSLDGPPTRSSACTPLKDQNGTAIDTKYGRLDGTLRYVVPIGGPSSCNGDSAHVHLQVDVNGDIYDVAIDIGDSPDDVGIYEANMSLPGGAWAEGWHGTDQLTYTSLGIHSPQFMMEDPAALSSQLVTELAQVNHVSIFGMGYDTYNGCHDVHYENGNGEDGALFVDPLSPQAHGLFFRFKTDSF
jgi:hypothetical protein